MFVLLILWWILSTLAASAWVWVVFWIVAFVKVVRFGVDLAKLL